MREIARAALAILLAGAPGAACFTGDRSSDELPLLPEPTQLAQPVPGIAERVERAAGMPEPKDSRAIAQALRTEVDAIAREYGELSLAHAEAELAGGLALSERGFNEAARPFLSARLGLCERLLGEWHRETAFAVADVGVLEAELAGDAFVPEIEPLLRRALAIRLRVLGDAHAETAGSKLFLAQQLAHSQRRDPSSLAEAQTLADGAREVFRKPLPDRDAIWAAEVAADVAHLRGEHERAIEILEPIARAAEQPGGGILIAVRYGDSLRIYANALRALGRVRDAERAEALLARFDLSD